MFAISDLFCCASRVCWIDVKRLVGIATALAGGRLGSAVVNGFSLVLLARSMPPNQLAALAALLAVVTLMAAVSDCGLTSAALRYAGSSSSRDVDALRRANTTVSCWAGCVTVLGLALWKLAGASPWGWIILSQGLWLSLDRIAEFRLAISVAQSQARLVLLGNLSRRAVPLVGLLLVTVIAPSSSLAAAYLLLLPLGSLACIAVLGSSGKTVGRASFRRGVKLGAPFWLNSAAMQVRLLDVVVVTLVGGGAASAAYGLVARLIQPLRIIPTSLAQVALTRNSRSVDDQRLLLSSLGLSLGLFAPLVIAAPVVVPWAFGSSYEESIAPLQVVLVALVVAGVVSMQTSILQRDGRARSAGIANMLSAPVALVLVALGTREMGAVGAASGLAVGYMVQALGLYLAGRLDR